MEKKCAKCKRMLPIDQFSRHRKYYQSYCKECGRVKNKEFRQKNPEYSRTYLLNYKFKVTPEWYQFTLIQQDHACAICSKSVQEEKKSLAVDHHHASGKVRGLLCQACNCGIGNFKEDLTLLKQAIEYLKKWQS